MSLVSRKAVVLVVAASIPALLFLNVWQGVRYSRLREEVGRLEAEQTAWFERNKNLLAAVGIYSSPKRLDAIAAQDPLVSKPAAPGAIRVEVEQDGGAAPAAGKAPQ
jgi:hypothetical protein